MRSTVALEAKEKGKEEIICKIMRFGYMTYECTYDLNFAKAHPMHGIPKIRNCVFRMFAIIWRNLNHSNKTDRTTTVKRIKYK